MSQLAVDLSDLNSSSAASLEAGSLATFEAANSDQAVRVLGIPSREVLILCGIMAVLQVSDGVLTAFGMNEFGTGAEGNPFLRMLMEEVGHVPALALAKTFSLGILVMLAFLANSVPWLTRALKGIIGLYLVTAIIPWTAILLTEWWA